MYVALNYWPRLLRQRRAGLARGQRGEKARVVPLARQGLESLVAYDRRHPSGSLLFITFAGICYCHLHCYRGLERAQVHEPHRRHGVVEDQVELEHRARDLPGREVLGCGQMGSTLMGLLQK